MYLGLKNLGIINPHVEGTIDPTALFAQNEPGVVFDAGDRYGASESKTLWRRNLLTWTERFSDVAWTKASSTIGVNTTTAPDGTVTADTIIPNSGVTIGTANNGTVVRTITPTRGATYTASIYAKPSGFDRLRFRMYEQSVFSQVNSVVSLTDGSVVTSPATSTEWSNVNLVVTPANNGFYRIAITGTFLSSSTFGLEILPADSVATTGDGVSGVFVWGVQLELASSASEYQRITNFSDDFRQQFPTHSLYQLFNGVTPAIYPGDPVGLHFDTSRGAANKLGPELVTNGDFSNGTTGWNTVAGSTLTVNGSGQLEIATGTQAISLNSASAITTVAGRMYLLEVDVIALSTGTQGIIVGTSTSGSNLVSDLRTTTGKRSAVFLATTTTSHISWSCGSTSRTATIDNISVREIPGVHRYQNANTASRPVLARIPEGGRRNLLTRTEEFDNVYWQTSNSTITANVAANPVTGELTADRMTTSAANGEVRASGFTYPSTGVYTFTCYVKSETLPQIILRLERNTNTANVTFTFATETVSPTGANIISGSVANLGNGWYRLRATANVLATSWVVGITAGTGTGDILLWGAQMELNSSATDYQKVTVNADVTEIGKRDCWGLLYDGIDDSFITPSVDFSSTDKITLMTGVRKLSDAASATLVELTADANSNNGAFALYAPRIATASFDVRSRGTLTATISEGSTSASPITAVISGLADIAGDSLIIRKNGVQAGSSTADQGSGNYANEVLYFGRRNNASLPFTGIEFITIIRGAATDTGLISAYERGLLAKRAGISI